MAAVIQEAGHHLRFPFDPIHRIREAFSAWAEGRRLAAELSTMSDRELADIGLNRGDVPVVLSGKWDKSGSLRA